MDHKAKHQWLSQYHLWLGVQIPLWAHYDAQLWGQYDRQAAMFVRRRKWNLAMQTRQTIRLRGTRPMLQHHEISSNVGDALAVATVAGTLMEYLPPLAAILTIVWTVIRIWESSTVQKWWTKR